MARPPARAALVAPPIEAEAAAAAQAAPMELDAGNRILNLQGTDQLVTNNRDLVPAQGTARERDTRELRHGGHGQAGEKEGAAAAPPTPPDAPDPPSPSPPMQEHTVLRLRGGASERELRARDEHMVLRLRGGMDSVKCKIEPLNGRNYLQWRRKIPACLFECLLRVSKSNRKTRRVFCVS